MHAKAADTARTLEVRNTKDSVMNYWWVNQNQTAKQEVSGGYMWSPKRMKDGKRNPFYEGMRECAPGDLVFSFVDTRISNLGVVTSFCDESPRPQEFGVTGDQWDTDGWRVGVDFQRLSAPIKPADHMNVIAPTLPVKYSPIRPDGGGNQIYLARVPSPMAVVLMGLIGPEAEVLARRASGLPSDSSDTFLVTEAREDALETSILGDSRIPETERQALVRSRIGQGLFRDRVVAVEPRCRVTGVANPFYCIASHIKPWRHSDNTERLDGNNGLLLARHIDHLFDEGFISFAGDGLMLVSPAADVDALRAMGVPVDSPLNVGTFNEGQRGYLEYHRVEVFKKAVIGE
jgi:putative restriction endonuclease